MSKFRSDFRYQRRKYQRKLFPRRILEYDYNKELESTLGKLRLDHPVYYPEKINWIKWYHEDPLYVSCTDKFEVRKYVEDKGLGHILNELYGVYDRIEDIDFDSLPDSFVLRMTHGCGMNILCPDKTMLDKKQALKKMKRWWKIDYSIIQGEKWYTKIKPRIVCEKFLQDDTSHDLKDFKIFCFHGKPHVVQVDIGRYKNHLRNYYDVNWELRDVYCEHDNDTRGVPRPKQFDKMLEYARILSQPFMHVRVDFYEVNGEVVFGEMTFAPGSGVVPFTPISFLKEMGDLIHLPIEKNKN